MISALLLVPAMVMSFLLGWIVADSVSGHFMLWLTKRNGWARSYAEQFFVARLEGSLAIVQVCRLRSAIEGTSTVKLMTPEEVHELHARMTQLAFQAVEQESEARRG